MGYRPLRKVGGLHFLGRTRAFFFKLPVILRDFVVVINFGLFLAVDIGLYHVGYRFLLWVIPPHAVYLATRELSAAEYVVTCGILVAGHDQCSDADE